MDRSAIQRRIQRAKKSMHESSDKEKGGCAMKSLLAIVATMVAAVGMQSAMTFWACWWNISRFHAASATLPRSPDGVLTMITITLVNVAMFAAAIGLTLVGCILNTVVSSSWRQKGAVFTTLVVLLSVSYWVCFRMDAAMQTRFGRVRTLPSVAPQAL